MSGLDATKKLTSGKGSSSDSAAENEFPEASIDEMRAQMELVLSRYISDAERKEQMRAKMTESDAETLLSENNRGAGDVDRNRRGNGTSTSEMDDYDGKQGDRDPSPNKSKASSSGGSKAKKSTHK